MITETAYRAASMKPKRGAFKHYTGYPVFYDWGWCSWSLVVKKRSLGVCRMPVFKRGAYCRYMGGTAQVKKGMN